MTTTSLSPESIMPEQIEAEARRLADIQFEKYHAVGITESVIQKGLYVDKRWYDFREEALENLSKPDIPDGDPLPLPQDPKLVSIAEVLMSPILERSKALRSYDQWFDDLITVWSNPIFHGVSQDTADNVVESIVTTVSDEAKALFMRSVNDAFVSLASDPSLQKKSE